MSQLGKFLREQREARGITLEELQTRTKIRIRYLQAIEAGDFAVIPGEVYLRGFIRNVAKELGLEPQEVMNLYYQDIRPAKENQPKEISVDKQKPLTAQPTLGQHSASPPPSPYTSRRSRQEKKANPTRLLWVLVLAGLILSGLFFWDHFMGPGSIVDDPNVPPNSNDQEEPNPEPEPEPEPEPSQVMVALQNPGERNPIFHVSPGPIEIVLQAEGGACWIGASADGGAQQQVTLTPGGETPSLTVRAEREIVVRVGNPSVLRLSINGLDQGIIGGGTSGIDLTVKLVTDS